MLRRAAPVSASLLAFSLLAGCDLFSGAPDPEAPEFEVDAFETDDTRDLAKEQPVNGPPQYRTLWPAGDVDFVRFRVDEVDSDGEDENGPHYGITPPYYTAAVYAELWNDEGLVDLSADAHYRMTDGGFTVPGIYYLKLCDDGVTGGECRTWITFHRDGETRDLVATEMAVPMEVVPGEEAAFNVWLVNQGGATAGKFHVALYLSADRARDAGDTLLAGERVEYELAEGYSYGLPVSIESFPSVAPALTGPVYVIAVVDSDSEVAEVGYEDNNIFVGSTLVDPAAYESAAGPEPASAAPTPTEPVVVQRRRLLYPARNETPGEEVAADVDLVELVLHKDLRYCEIWTENLVGWADTKLEIVDSAGDPLEPAIEAEDGGLGNGASYLLVDKQNLDAAGPGPWYVRITDEHGNSGGYDLVVRASPDDSSTTHWYGPDEFEPDGNVGTWRVLRADSADAWRSFSTADDEDWCAYPVPVADSGRGHTIETHSLSDCDTVLELYDSTGEALPYSDDDSGGEAGASRLEALALPAGLYYVRVTNKNTQAGATYKLRAVVTDF